ncbi:MAG TPA: peptidoglycan-binding protein [Oscillatoriaceae cyanobacterium]
MPASTLNAFSKRLYELVSGPKGASWAPVPGAAPTGGSAAPASAGPLVGGQYQLVSGPNGAQLARVSGTIPGSGQVYGQDTLSLSARSATGAEPIGGSALLTQGASGSNVRTIQQELQSAGFSPGGVDGIFGPNTANAVRAFQRARGLQVDGVVGPQTEAALSRTQAPAPAPAPAASYGGGMLGKGSTGPSVVQLQQKLAAAGFNPGGVDGDFGPNTLNAVMAFQRARGLQVDGVVGPQTAGALGMGAIQTSAPAPSSGGFGGAAVAAARQLQANGYHYTVNLTSDYHPVRFQVGCCADFAVDSWAKAGIDLYNQVSDPHYCPTLVNYFKNGGGGHHWIPAGGRAAPGDMVFFDWDGDGVADHTAIVSAVDGNGRPTSIVESYDFNLPVRERAIGSSLNNVLGYGRA